MSNTNPFVTWATGTGANVAAIPGGYAGMSIRQLGAQVGQADPVSFNSALRQASVIAAMIGQFTADYGSSNLNDDGNISTLEAQFIAALQAVIAANIVTNYPSLLPPRNVLLNRNANGSGNATVPAKITEIYYEVMGAGGGGAGGGTGNTFSGGGGGGGGLAKGWIVVAPGDTIAWVCGNGGAGSNQGVGVTGNPGSLSSITHGGTVISATGGAGGTAGTATAAGGEAGQGIGGQINYFGANGGDGNNQSAAAQGGPGGSSAYGGGGRTSTDGHGRTTQIDGLAPGSGGGGVWGTAMANQIGGYGADGGILLMY